MGRGRSNSYQILRQSFFSFLTKITSCGFLAGDCTHWLRSYLAVLLSFQEKSVTDALAFSTAKIPAVDRINLLNWSVNNRKSVFSHPHAVIHVITIFGDSATFPKPCLLYMETTENSYFEIYDVWTISCSHRESLCLHRVFRGTPVCSVMLIVSSGVLYKFK